MAYTHDDKSSGQLIRSADWNNMGHEVVRLETAKVNRAGDTISGDLKVTGKFSVSGEGRFESTLGVVGSVNFGAATRQMLNLWNSNYGIGVQNSTQYFRTDKNFAWFKAGVHADGELDAGAGGSAQMVLKDGSLGIGTNTPKQTLDVNGRMNVENGVIQRGGEALTTTSDLGLYSRVDSQYIRIVSTNAPIRFYTDGGVGSKVSLSVETNRVEVNSNLLLSGDNDFITGLGMLRMGTPEGSSTTTGKLVGGIGFAGYGVQHGQFSFRAGKGFELVDRSSTKPGLDYDYDAYPYADLKVKNLFATGNIGIGTTTPGSNKLRVEGGPISTSGNLHTQRNRLAFSNTADDPNHTIYNNGNNIDGEGAWDGMKMNVFAGLNVRVGDANGKTPASALYIDGSGNIGVGANDPGGFKLSVSGDLRANRYIVQDSVDGGPTKGIWMWNAGDSNWGIYMGTSGAKKSLAGNTATGGDGFVGHSIRVRTYSDPNNGFIYENNNEQLNFSVRASDGNGYFRGALSLGNSDIYFTKTDHNHSGFGNTNGYAAIENAANYDALMILGRAHTGGSRIVKLWDYLEVNGTMKVTGSTLTIGDWTLSSEGTNLFIKRGGSVVARFSTDWDRFIVFKDLNNTKPYFFFNQDGNYGTYRG